MGSVTTNPQPVANETILQAEIAALASKHVTVSYTLVGVIVLVLALAGAGGWYALRMFDKQLARAEAAEARYDTDRKQFADLLAADATTRAKSQTQQVALATTGEARDKKADEAIQVAVKPDATLATTAAGLTSAYSDVVGFGQVDVLPGSDALHGPGIELAGHQAQQVTAYKIDRDRLSADLSDLRTSYTLEQTSNSSLTNDLAQCKDLNAKSDKVIAGYKKLAKKTKWKTFLSGAKKAVVIGALVVTAVVAARSH